MRWLRIAKSKIRNFFTKDSGPKAKVVNSVYSIPQELRDEYLRNWNRAKINDSDKGKVARGLDIVRPHIEKYNEVASHIDCNIHALICSHYREAGCDFDRQILNGQAWDMKTTIVPKGEGPFESFEVSCKRGFDIKPKMEHENNIIDILHFLERWNGWGYRRRGVWSPYLWSYTNLYVKGYYTSDGKFSMNAVNRQLGCASLLIAILEEYHLTTDENGKIIPKSL